MRFSKWPLVFSFVAFFIGVTVLVGWSFGIAALKSVLPGAITMKSNTAFCFVLSAIAVSATSIFPERRVLSRILAVAVGSIAIATLVEYVVGVDLKIDQFLFTDPDGLVGRFPPGRLAPITAVCFICTSVAVILLESKNSRLRVTAQMLASFVLFTSFQSFVAFMIGLKSLFGSAFFTRMAFHTSVAFIALGLAIISLRPDEGLLQIFSNRTRLGKANRFIIAAIVLFPPLVRVFSVRGYERGFYDEDFATLIQVVGGSALMCVVFVIAAQLIFKSEIVTKESEEELRQSESRFRLLGDTMTQLAWIASGDGYINWYNQRWYEYTGMNFEQMRGEGWAKVHHPDHVDTVLATSRVAWQSDQPWEMTFPLRSKEGEWRWFLTRVVPTKDAEGKVIRWLGTNTDVTEQVETTNELRRAAAEAEKASQMKSAFIANMSHEMRTPLGVILGFSDLLNADQAKESHRENYQHLVQKNGRRLKKLIDDVIELSKLDADESKLQIANVSPEQVVREIIEDVVLDSDVKPSIDIVDDWKSLGAIKTDSPRLKKVLLNILENAVKFSDGGRVSINIRPTVKGSDNEVEFLITDSGIGLDEQTQERLFEPFFQGDERMVRKYGGTGIGLSLSRRLSRLLGGDVDLVQSAIGQGSTFRIRIKNQKHLALEQGLAIATLKATQNPQTPSPLSGKRVLIADDSAENRILIKRQLQRRGAQTVEAENGAQAVQLVKSEPRFDIILMDIQMPVMDGYDATAAIRKLGFQGPIFAVTAHALDDVVERCREVGCDQHIPKPLDFDHLTNLIVNSAV